MFTVAALFSINYIISKVAMQSFAPLSFAFLRSAGAAIVLNIIIAAGRNGPADRLSSIDSWRIVVFAVLGVALNQTMFLAGLSLTSAHVAAILITTIPIFTLLVAIASGLERPTAMKIAGIVLALAGALLVIGGEGIAGLIDGLTGSLLITGNCIAYAIYLVLSKPVVTRLSPLLVISRMFAIGSALIFPLAIPALRREHWGEIPGSAWLSLLAVIAGPTVAAYLINAWALRYAESSIVAAYSYVQPVLTAILAWVFLHEHIRGVVAIAALLIFAGVWMAARRSSVLGPRSSLPLGP